MTALLPYVKIAFQNGMLGITTPSEDGVCGLIPGGAVVVANYTAKNGVAYLINSPACITETGTDAVTYQAILDFYAEAGEGAELWLLNAKPASTASGVTSLQTLSNGACRAIASVIPMSTPGTEVSTINTAAVALEQSIYAPVMVIVGIATPNTIGSAVDLSEGSSNRVAVVCGNKLTGVTATDTELKKGACVGLLLGRVAKNAVQVSVARVADGPINAEKLAFGEAEINNSDAQTLCGKGYIVPRTWTGKAGYFFSSDQLATVLTDDYGLIPRRRTIDKAFRIAYKTLLNEVGTEIPVKSDGGIPVSTAKSIEAMVETALEKSMTNLGNLGKDPDDDSDNGIKVYVDPSQNVVATNKIVVSVKVKPYGYAYYIEANLSFYTTE